MAAAPHLGEFERIARFFKPLAAPEALGLVDDVALIDGPDGEQYVLTTDAIVEGVDYFPEDPPDQVARKLLRVNLSDLAAKGARPFGYLVTTVLPATRGEAWLEAFVAGLAADQAEYGIGLWGGDSSGTPGPTTLSVTAIGRIARGQAVLRSGARDGDVVYVSGTLGDGALGLCALRGELPGLSVEERDFLIDRYHLPRPRVGLGPRLVGVARAMIDISDGLIADLGHICETSRLGATVEQVRLPLSPAARHAVTVDSRLNQAVIGGGDDYELLFAAPPDAAERVAEASRAAGVAIAEIGRMERGAGVRLLDAAGVPLKVDITGYAHF